MSPEARATLDSHFKDADTIVVHRGFGLDVDDPADEHLGRSWTIDKDKAAWFAARWNDGTDREPYVASIEIPRDVVLAFLGGRGEGEIVVDTDWLHRNESNIEIRSV